MHTFRAFCCPPTPLRLAFSLLAATFFSLSALLGADVEPTELGPDFFDQQVQPILAEHCFKCHGGEKKLRGNLRLTSRLGVLDGGDSGPAVDLDDLDASLLLEAVNYEGLEMPPSGKLPEEQRAVLTAWVKSSVPWSRTTQDFGLQDEAPAHRGPPPVNEETRAFWSYQPVRRPSVPEVADSAWVRNPIDAFVLRKLEENQLQPNPPADRRALLRRAYYDLTGLPPTPEEAREFADDPSPQAYEAVVESLLASRHYGERWGRHWLDLVRFAESNSFERDGDKPHIWRYRDYVIDSFNEDKPFDQFVREQLAGDELDFVTAESFIATGFYRVGQWDDEPTDQLQADFDGLDDILTTTCQVFLGMTVNCARCHDHKIDPIPQADYYRMLAFFRNVRPYGHRSLDQANLQWFDTATGRRVESDVVQNLREQKQRLAAQLRTVENRVREKLSPPEQEDFRFEDNRISILRQKSPALISADELAAYEETWNKLREVRTRDDEIAATTLTAIGVGELGAQPPPTHILIRGSAHAPGDEVSPGFPSVLGFADPPPNKDDDPARPTSGRRRVLADWIARTDNPLTARVWVNRIWQHHFGRGIVDTPNDFGFQGAPPSHPELLDWLASELMDGGWKLKRLHKLIMTSNAYRMSAASNPSALAADPENRLLWRMDMRRLSAEEIRDSLLAVNGSLNLKAAGPSVFPEIPADVLAGQSRPGDGWGESSPDEEARRSIYVYVKRSLVTPILASFDFADTDTSCPVRFVTTQPTQALGMLNSEFLHEQAELLAQRVRRDAGDDPAAQIRRALELALSREPADDEVAWGLRLIQDLQATDGASAASAWQQFCLLVLNLNEFIYLD